MLSYQGSSSNTSSSTYPIIVCSNCSVQLCWGCFSQLLHTLTPKLQQNILHRWANSWAGRTIYNYTWQRVNNDRILFGHTHPPHQLIHYAYIFDPNLRWIDYFAVHQFAKSYRTISIIMYCEDIQSPFRLWSLWFNLLLQQYIPRVSALRHATPQLLLSVLQTKMAEAALNYDTLHFNLLYKRVFYNWGFTSDHQLAFFPSYDFYGEVYLPSHLQDAFMQHSPFSACF